MTASLKIGNTWILVPDDEIPSDRQILDGKWAGIFKKISKDPPNFPNKNARQDGW
jgi:hypothetical protein